ncbi:hypothetical protein NPIL_538541 [Nephila pilipes]|uniref:Uncharacterized protein n=1 Tax=Nephila pilipes TaxID=299642 RepID=A0A8X6TIX8_NEPPI|nr:hypothetical protein NPIL_538541 [Nephila pilipes]
MNEDISSERSGTLSDKKEFNELVDYTTGNSIPFLRIQQCGQGKDSVGVPPPSGIVSLILKARECTHTKKSLTVQLEP